MRLSADQKQRLINLAQEAREAAYAPYSGYAVGAALLTAGGQVFTGANVENAVYPVTMCAERVAVFSAVASGEREFDALVVATRNGGTPCGSCRQVLAEFGLDTRVVMVDDENRLALETTVKELLPEAFGSGDLQD